MKANVSTRLKTSALCRRKECTYYIARLETSALKIPDRGSLLVKQLVVDHKLSFYKKYCETHIVKRFLESLAMCSETNLLFLPNFIIFKIFAKEKKMGTMETRIIPRVTYPVPGE